MSTRLWKFFGGLKLAGFKTISMSQATEVAPISKTLVLPLKQHIGHPAEANVKVGSVSDGYSL